MGPYRVDRLTFLNYSKNVCAFYRRVPVSVVLIKMTCIIESECKVFRSDHIIYSKIRYAIN
jgi:hypothetical protein